ncbi:GntR family transcriptional regulator [Stenotrophomonas maltophilia]|uniref:GntR family transcriptional regulator n=1 Tax=Stenotrophomonas maltophilia TaxID=40324 RepID=UPI00209B458C|nr:GntR family transcriptional regulator [Stenotrophomonas maltophilia]MCO7486974.1 GntR family transcriptional regulator [Stenotrophomonas maltophilia]
MEWGSKSTRLYEEIRQSLQSGGYAPGTRLDATALAKQFQASTTPVRHALYRLVGEGLAEDHARDGFFVPPVTEWFLRDLYNWMRELLILACDGIASYPEVVMRPPSAKHGDDVVTQTRELFEEIALARASLQLTDTVRRANARLEAIRKAEQQLLDDAPKEIAELQRLWGNGEVDTLKSVLAAYHERRLNLVPRIVAALGAATSRRPA